jgi:hypothetical protein
MLTQSSYFSDPSGCSVEGAGVLRNKARLCPRTLWTFLREFVTVTNAPHRPSGVERRQRMADDRPNDDDVSPAATL